MIALRPCRLLLLLMAACATVHVAAEPRRAILPNRVRLVLQPEPASELVAISVCIRTGPDRSALEDATGELVSRSLFGSSLNRSPDRLATAYAQIGGSVETSRTAEHVNITFVVLPARVREAIYLLCDVLKNADFETMERTRRVLLAEQRRSDAGLSAGLDVLRRELQARPSLADLPFQRVSRNEAEAYFRTRYVPERTAIAVVGQFDAPSVQLALRDSLSDFDRLPVRPIRSEPLYLHATNFPTRTLIQPGASGYALIAIGAPGLIDPDYPAFVVLESILGEGHASRLFQRLRDARGIGYNVGAAWQASLSDPLVTYLQWEVRPSRASLPPAPTGAPPDFVAADHHLADEHLDPASALHLVAEQIDGMESEPPSEREVQRARNLAIGREVLRHERARDRAFLLAMYEAMDVGPNYDSTLPARLAAVTAGDVVRAAHTYLNPRASVLIVPEP